MSRVIRPEKLGDALDTGLISDHDFMVSFDFYNKIKKGGNIDDHIDHLNAQLKDIKLVKRKIDGYTEVAFEFKPAREIKHRSGEMAEIIFKSFVNDLTKAEMKVFEDFLLERTENKELVEAWGKKFKDKKLQQLILDKL